MKKIRTFDELVSERKRLENDLVVQRAYIKGELHAIHDKLKPFTRMAGIFGRVKNKLDDGSKGSALFKFGSTVGIDLLVGQKLKKAGWLAKLLIPLAMKLTAQKAIDKVEQRVAHR